MSQTSDGKVIYTTSGKLVPHGSPSSYNNHRCRCDECRKAWAAYVKPYIQAKRKRDKEINTIPNVRVRFE